MPFRLAVINFGWRAGASSEIWRRRRRPLLAAAEFGDDV